MYVLWMTKITHYMIRSTRKISGSVQGGATGAAAPDAILKGAPIRHWSNRRCSASKLRFSHAKEFIRKIICNFGTRPRKTFASSVLGRKSLKNICSMGHQIISLPGGAQMSPADPGKH